MEWTDIQAMLPLEWEQKCFDLEAMVRSRKIKSPSELLEMVITYVTVTDSLSLTAGIMAAKDVKISKVALFKRLKSAGNWLEWMVKALLSDFGILMTKPQWLGEKSVLLVDGSSIVLKGSNGTDHILHLLFDLFSFSCKSLDLTSFREGEKISRFGEIKNSIIIGDRGYVSVAGMEHVWENEADFIFRYRTRAFNLYDKSGKRIELKNHLKGLGDFECDDVNCFYLSNGKLKPLRICIMKKDERAIIRQGKQLKTNFSHKEIEAFNEERRELNKYIILCTNLNYNTQNIFELYRNRWQIELIFKELKSVLGFGDVPSSNKDSVKAWLYAKLLVAVLSLLLMNKSHFSPKD
jgi:hypothetical protein